MEAKMTTGKYNNINVYRLFELKQKVEAHTATKQEKNELMRIVYENDSLDPNLYSDYINGKYAEPILETGSMLATVILFGFVLRKKFGI